MAGSSNIHHVYFFLEDRMAHRKQQRDVASGGDSKATTNFWPLVKLVPDKTEQQSAPIISYDAQSGTVEPVTAISAQRKLSSCSVQTIKLNVTAVEPQLVGSATSPHSHTSSTGSVESRGSAFNPRAPVFRPRTSPSKDIATAPVPFEVYTLRESHGKGKGLFSNTFIPRGALIISEKPLISIANDLDQVTRVYNALSKAQKTSYDELHFHQPQDLDLESASKAGLVDAVDSYMDSTDGTVVATDQVRTMSRFAANNFATTDEHHLAVFTTIARINHSCVPNVYHFYNEYENRMTIYASQDIADGTELLLDYIQGASTYQIRAQRTEQLRSKYGFTCHCPACSDGSGSSDDRRTTLNDIMWGLQAYIDEGPGQPSEPYSFHPSSPEMALRQAKDALELFWIEAITNVELLKALRIASMVSLEVRGLKDALEYVRFEDRVVNDLVGPAAYLIHPLNRGPASVWARHIERMIMNEYGYSNNASALPMNQGKECGSGSKQLAYHDQLCTFPTGDPPGTNSQAEDAGIAKDIQLKKKKMQRSKAKAQKRAKAKADALPPAKSSINARHASGSKGQG